MSIGISKLYLVNIQTFLTRSKLSAMTKADGKFLARDKLRRRQRPSKY